MAARISILLYTCPRLGFFILHPVHCTHLRTTTSPLSPTISSYRPSKYGFWVVEKGAGWLRCPPPRHRILARECFQGRVTQCGPSHPLSLPTNRHTLSMSLARCNKCSLDMPATLRLAIAPHGLLEPAIWRSKTGHGLQVFHVYYLPLQRTPTPDTATLV